MILRIEQKSWIDLKYHKNCYLTHKYEFGDVGGFCESVVCLLDGMRLIKPFVDRSGWHGSAGDRIISGFLKVQIEGSS